MPSICFRRVQPAAETVLSLDNLRSRSIFSKEKVLQSDSALLVCSSGG